MTSKYPDSKDADRVSSNSLSARIEQLESLCLSIEQFTHSGSWVYDKNERTIEFSVGASNLLGLFDADRPVPLTLLECMCRESDRERLVAFLASGHSSRAGGPIDIVMQDSFGNQMAVVMCLDSNARWNEVRKHGLIKSLPQA